MIFAHTNGVISLSRYVPREIYFCNIITLKSRGLVADIDHLTYTAKDVDANQWVYSHGKSGLKHPQPVSSNGDEVAMEDVRPELRRFHRELGRGTIFVKGHSQETCLKNLLPHAKIVNLDVMLPLYDTLKTEEKNCDEYHVSKFHVDGGDRCSQVVARRYCAHIKQNMDILLYKRLTG